MKLRALAFVQRAFSGHVEQCGANLATAAPESRAVCPAGQVTVRGVVVDGEVVADEARQGRPGATEAA